MIFIEVDNVFPAWFDDVQERQFCFKFVCFEIKLQAFLGGAALSLGGQPLQKSALRGKRLNVCIDLPRARIGGEAIGVIKMLTGDDTITVEEKFKPSESYKPTCKLLFGSKFSMMSADNDPAFRARLVVMSFRYPIPKERQDKHLPGKLLAERFGIAVRALDAYWLLKAGNYCFTQIQGNMCLMTGYVAASDIIGAFLCGCCEFSDEAHMFTANLQEAYNQFCTVHCAPPIRIGLCFRAKSTGFVQDGSRQSDTRMGGI